MQKQKTKAQIKKARARKDPVGFFQILLKWGVRLCLFLFITSTLIAAAIFYYLNEDLPKISTLADYRPPVVTTVYSDDDRKIAEFFKERRIVIPLPQMPRMLIEAFIAAEDSRFYKHQGIDYISVLRAMFKNIEAGGIVQGGSTITQQVTKSFFLTPEKNYTRKIKEAILAYRIDNAFSKDDILYLYLNQIYLGHGAYGVAAAAENYFGKTVETLNLGECAILAGLPQAPSRYSPFRNPDRAKQRQLYVLNRMMEEGFITNAQYTEAIHTPLDIKPRKNLYMEEAPYYTEYIRQYVLNTYGEDALYNGGLTIYSAVNIDMQKTARTEIEKGLRELDKRQGYRGPLKHLLPAGIESFVKELKMTAQEDNDASSGATEDSPEIVTGVVVGVDNKEKTVRVRMAEGVGVIALQDMRWARKPDPNIPSGAAPVRQPGDFLSVGDVIQVAAKGKAEEGGIIPLRLEQTPLVQVALMCMETGTGKIKTMVGGRDFKENQFNRAIQSRRQPGSAFKPLIYAAAMDKGCTPATVIVDSPIYFKDASNDFKWQPKNYENTYNGPTLLRDALAHSRNIVSIKLLQRIGVKYAVKYAHKLGIDSTLSPNLSLALGASGVSLQELLIAYSVFANYGNLITPIYITKIVDRDGNILELNVPTRKTVIEKSTAYLITSMLESVVKEGTGKRAIELQRPVAGKTGTTNNLNDAWFLGYTPQFVTGVWVGFDNEASLGEGETGAKAALPIWLGFMKQVLSDKPVKIFEVPEGVVFSKIDSGTGLLPISESRNTRFEVFKEGTQPKSYTAQPEADTEVVDLFKSDL